MKTLLIEIARVLRQLRYKLASAKKIDAFLVELGYDLPFERVEEEFKTLHTGAEAVLMSIEGALKSIDVIFEQDEKDEFIAVLDLLYYIDEVHSSIEGLTELARTTFSAIRDEIDQEYREPFKRVFDDDFISEFNRRLIDYLWYTKFVVTRRKLFAVLGLLGLVEEIPFKADSSILQPEFELKKIWWERIPNLLHKPDEVFNEVYQWETQFNYQAFLQRLQAVVHAYGLPGGLYPISEARKLKFQIPGENEDEELRFPILHRGEFPEDYLSIDLNIFGLPLIEGERKQGIGASVSSNWGTTTTFPLGKKKEVVLQAALGLDDGVGLLVEPKFKAELYDAFDTGNEKKVGYNVRIIYQDQEEPGETNSLNRETVVVGTAEGAKLSFSTYKVVLDFSNQEKENSISVTLNIIGGKIVLKAPKSDGFLSKVLGTGDLSIDFELGVGISSLHGFHLTGSAGTERVIPLHKRIGPVHLLEFIIGFGTEFSSNDFSAHLDFGASLEVEIGPILAALHGLKVRNVIKKKRNPFKDFRPMIIPPKIIKLLIDASGIYGGGYLEIDQDNDRYAGILSLNLQAIELTAIGLITTKLPNNKDGFSMLLSISVLFKPAIQLSFGFTLNGVGGLIGVNRTFNIQALRERMISGAMESIMFPRDVIKNANRVISDLRAVFPAKEKHFVIAPFLKLGWGGASIVEVDLGVLIEIPFKGRIVLLGSVGVYLPVKEKPITELHIDVLGDFNFAEQYIRIDGVLRQSHIVKVPLKGGFAFVLSWDKNPQFLLSIGGYHPRYKKPERFPDVKRLTAIVQKGKKLKMTCELYTAITSNSFQIGFKADLYLKYKGARINGYFGFNALLYFDPFVFEADINLGVLVKYKGKKLAGVDLYFVLTGPKPWTARGRAKIKVAFIKLKVKFKATWGDKQKIKPRTVEPAYLLQELKKQLETPRNWAAKLPASFKSSEILREIEDDEQTIILHPAGYLEVRQNAVPLERKIQKYGNASLNELPTYSLQRLTLGGQEVSERQTLKEYFARGQYENLSDAEKISSKDFELYKAGYRFGDEGAGFDFGEFEMTSTDSTYENIVITEELQSLYSENEEVKDWESLREKRGARGNRFLEESDIAFQQAEETVAFLEEEDYLVVDSDGNQIGPSFASEAEARLFILEEHSDQEDRYQIMTEEEYQSMLIPA